MGGKARAFRIRNTQRIARLGPSPNSVRHDRDISITELDCLPGRHVARQAKTRRTIENQLRVAIGGQTGGIQPLDPYVLSPRQMAALIIFEKIAVEQHRPVAFAPGSCLLKAEFTDAGPGPQIFCAKPKYVSELHT